MAKRVRRANVPLEQWVRLSPFIVRGTIRKIGAATMPSVPVTRETVVVQVNEVLSAPPSMRGFARRNITIQLRSPGVARVGERAIFFTRGWIYGEGIAVMEVGRISGVKDDGGIRQAIAEAQLRVADENLERRIAKAALVVLGRVVTAAPVRRKRERAPQTEHDPDWWEAEVSVSSVEKGRLPDPRLVVLFPNSTDEMWIDCPKFSVGQEGIWVLQKDQKEKGWPIVRLPGYTALDPLDFQVPGQLDRVRALIARARA